MRAREDLASAMCTDDQPQVRLDDIRIYNPRFGLLLSNANGKTRVLEFSTSSLIFFLVWRKYYFGSVALVTYKVVNQIVNVILCKRPGFAIIELLECLCLCTNLMIFTGNIMYTLRT
jgi:hypothetical protein